MEVSYYSYYVLQFFSPCGKLLTAKMYVCESTCVQSKSASRNTERAQTSLQALCNRRQERLESPVKHQKKR